MDNSILLNVKNMLGIDGVYDVFDLSVVTAINSAFMKLDQLGVGPETSFFITGSTETWDDFTTEISDLNAVKLYVALSTRLFFDPPTSSTLLEAIKSQISEYEWRLKIQSEHLKKGGETDDSTGLDGPGDS